MRAFNDSLDEIIDHHGLDIDAIEREFADVGGRVDLSPLPQLAAQAVRERAANYL